MVRPRSLRAALAAVAGVPLLLAVPVVDATPARAQTAGVQGAGSHGAAAGAAIPTAEGDAPLVVTIGSMSPSTVPERGPVTVTGTVSNRDDAAWSEIRLYPFISEEPMRTRAELADAAAVDPATQVGGRIFARGPLDTIDSLQPGETRSYTLRVRRAELAADANGVYWFGVHALGEREGEARDDVYADGRARTFLPRVPDREAPLPTALVVPLRQRIDYREDGSLAAPAAWAETLGSGGRLRSLVDLAGAADGRPVNWLVDPALTDAAARLAGGNQPRSLAPTLDPDEPDDPDLQQSGSPSPSTSPTPSEEPREQPADGEGARAEEPDAEERAAAEVAQRWLDRLHELLDRPGQVLALPYGDLDVPAAAAHGPDFYDRARRRSGSTLAPWDVRTTPVVHAPGGQLDEEALGLSEPGETVLVSDEMFRGRVSTVAAVDGRRVVVASAGAATGGPGPDDRLAPVALRQRILAEAAVRQLGARNEPLVVVLPGDWTPSPTASFFDGLDVPWLRLTTVQEVAVAASTAVPRDRVVYPEAQARRELDANTFAAARALIRAGTSLQTILSRNDRVAATVADEALTAVSYGQRGAQAAARVRALRSRDWIGRELGRVRIDAPPQVTLSSASGRFSATITNGLDQPVTVRIDAVADAPIRIETPSVVEIAPESSRTVLLSATTQRQGVHNVTLILTDAEGAPLGSTAELPVRAALVSDLIWVIIGAGAALLFGAIAVRLVRRVRRARRRQREDGDGGDSPADAAPAPAGADR